MGARMGAQRGPCEGGIGIGVVNSDGDDGDSKVSSSGGGGFQSDITSVCRLVTAEAYRCRLYILRTFPCGVVGLRVPCRLPCSACLLGVGVCTE